MPGGGVGSARGGGGRLGLGMLVVSGKLPRIVVGFRFFGVQILGFKEGGGGGVFRHLPQSALVGGGVGDTWHLLVVLKTIQKLVPLSEIVFNWSF